MKRGMTGEGKSAFRDSMRQRLIVAFRHFYAHECPELLVRDLKSMFMEGGGTYGVGVNEKTLNLPIR